MGAFQGIRPEGLMLLAENRLRDSKAFYDEHKEQIGTLVRQPMMRLIEDLAPMMAKIDPEIRLEPARMVSRVRRDTRFTKDKSMYRENVWIAFERPSDGAPTPGFWFEVSPDHYIYGAGIMNQPPRLMELFRREIEKDVPAFLRMLRPILRQFAIDGDKYARPKKSDLKPPVSEFYARKSVYLSHTEVGLDGAAAPALADELAERYKLLAPYYRFALRVCETFNAEGGQDNNRR